MSAIGYDQPDFLQDLKVLTWGLSGHTLIGGKPWEIIFEGSKLRPIWRMLMTEHPDRLTFALDNLFCRHWAGDRYLPQMAAWWRAISSLPDQAAHAIAHGNAERLWRLAPKPTSFTIRPAWEAYDGGPIPVYSARRGRN